MPAAMRCKLQAVDELWGGSQWRASRQPRKLGCPWATMHMRGAMYLQVVLWSFVRYLRRAEGAVVDVVEASSTMPMV